MAAPAAAMIATATPMSTVSGRVPVPDGIDPTVTSTVVEWVKVPLVTVTVTGSCPLPLDRFLPQQTPSCLMSRFLLMLE